MSAEFTETRTLPEEELDRLSQLGRAIYDEKLKAVLEPEHNGEVVAIHVDSGEYEVARNSPQAWKALRGRRPTGMILVTDIGPAKYDGLTLRMLGAQALTGPQK